MKLQIQTCPWLLKHSSLTFIATWSSIILITMMTSCDYQTQTRSDDLQQKEKLETKGVRSNRSGWSQTWDPWGDTRLRWEEQEVAPTGLVGATSCWSGPGGSFLSTVVKVLLILGTVGFSTIFKVPALTCKGPGDHVFLRFAAIQNKLIHVFLQEHPPTLFSCRWKD